MHTLEDCATVYTPSQKEQFVDVREFQQPKHTHSADSRCLARAACYQWLTLVDFLVLTGSTKGIVIQTTPFQHAKRTCAPVSFVSHQTYMTLLTHARQRVASHVRANLLSRPKTIFTHTHNSLPTIAVTMQQKQVSRPKR